MHIEQIKGRQLRSTWSVTSDMTVPSMIEKATWLRRHGQLVLASGYLIGIVEDTCWCAMLPLVDSHQGLVGNRFEMRHRAPAAPGDYVDIGVVCTAAAGRTVTWIAEVTNLRTKRTVAEAEHDVTVVDLDRFAQKVASAPQS